MTAVNGAADEVRAPWVYWVGVALGALTLTLFILLYGERATLDDLFTYMRYVANVLSGHGPVYNIGEQSAGTTSFAWLFISSGAAWIFGNSVIVWKLAGIVPFFLAVVLVFNHFRTLPLMSAAAVSLLALADPFAIRWYASGMENGLVCFFAIAYFTQLAQVIDRPTPRSVAALCLVSSLIVFVRPEYIVLATAVSVAVATLTGRIYKKILLLQVVLIVALGYAIYRWTGFILPQTGVAKALMERQHFSYYAPRTLIINAILAMPGALLATALWWRISKKQTMLFLAAWLHYAAIFIYFCYTDMLISTRYSVVYTAPLLFVTAMALAEAREKFGGWSLPMRGVLMIQAAACAAVLIWMWPATRLDEEAEIRPVAEWAKDNLPQGSVVALTEIGVFGYYYGGPIVDLIGLVSPEIVQRAQERGRAARGTSELEDLLIETRVGYYLKAVKNENNRMLSGHRVTFSPVAEWPILRDNLSHGRHLEATTWIMYRLDRNPAAAEAR